MNVVKHHYKKILLFLALLIVLVCLCPIPERINLSMQGAEWIRTGNGTEGFEMGESAKVEISGWHYRFLFLENFMNLSVRVEDAQGTHAFEVSDVDYNSYVQDGTEYLIPSCGYVNEHGNLRQVMFWWPKDRSELVLEIEGAAERHCYVTAEDTEASVIPIVNAYMETVRFGAFRDDG